MTHGTRFTQFAGAGLCALTLYGAAAAQIRRERSRRGVRDFVTVSSGNQLGYELRNGDADAELPLLVFESGHQASGRYWHWIAEALADYPVLLYSRAGYAASRYISRTSYSLSESVEDLQDLVAQVRGERRVALVGHSLGGLLVHRAASKAPWPVDRLVLLDPTHPEEIQRVPARAEGAKVLDRSHQWVTPSLRLGLGALLDIPEWVNEFPPTVAKSLRAELGDYSLWQATIREWSSLHQLFRSPPPLQHVEVPVSVIAAEVTLQTSPEQEELFREYVRYGTGGSFMQVPKANHLSMLSRSESATRCAELIRDALRANLMQGAKT